MAEHLRPLGTTRPDIRTQAHSTIGGPKKKSDRTFKDVTNKLKVRPTIANAYRPILKTNRMQPNNQIRIMKRPGKVWQGEGPNGPPTKSPFDKSNLGCLNKGRGSGSGRPPNPFDIDIAKEENMNPKSEGKLPILGEEGEEPRVEELQQSKDDSVMEGIAVSASGVEGVRST